ncbi:hypothetical protein B0H34DRAFT_413073 [Crassisporium funariophilum]|nr:hypothetical protein B0H34DRAFT_413073 [Crassisporium funariophilum]
MAVMEKVYKTIRSILPSKPLTLSPLPPLPMPLDNYGRRYNLPYDVLWEVITNLWDSPLSTEERVQFMTSSLLVSKGWMNIYTRVASRSVYIPCSSFLGHFMRTIRQECLIYDATLKELPNELCQSISIDIGPGDSESSLGKAFSDLLYRIKITGTLPNLRKLSVRYIDVSLDEMFNCYHFIDVPAQIESLELRYDGLFARHHLNLVRPSYPPWHLPFLRHLSVFGCSKTLVENIISGCPMLESLRTDLPLPQS